MVITEISAAKPPVNRQTHWNFGDPHGNPVSLEEFLTQQEAAGIAFFEGKEPWLKGLREVSWQTFSESAPKRWMIFLRRLQGS